MIGVVRIAGWVALLSVAQAAVIATVVCLALLALPRDRARLRHCVTLVALAVVAASLVGTATIMLADWRDHVACWNRAAGPRGAVPAECRYHGVPLPVGSGTSDPAEKVVSGADWKSLVRVPDMPGERTAARTWTDVAGIVGAAWLAALVLFGLRELRIRRALRAVRRESVPVRDPSVSAMLAALVDRLRVRAPVEVRESPAVETPCVVGLGRPLILIPRGLLEALDDGETRGVLAHELEHVRRVDAVAVSLQRTVESLLFFNPFATWIGRRAREEREAECDRIGAEVGTGSRTDYARTLLLLEGFRAVHLTTERVPALVGEGGLSGRVERLLAKSPAVARSVRVRAIALVIAATLLVGALVQATFAGASLGSWAVMADDTERRMVDPG